MIETNSYYWYGVTMAVYLVTCWMFSAVRAFHHCGTPKERRDYIWPDRKMQVGIYLTSVVLLLDPHLKLEQVVERCSFSRIYVSRVLTERFGSFFNYVNGLRLDYYDHYMAQHPNSTKEAAAEASGFTSYKAYTNVRERLPR